MKAVGQPIRKKDAMALVTGKPVFMDDLAPKDCLIVKAVSYTHLDVYKRQQQDIHVSVSGGMAVCYRGSINP